MKEEIARLIEFEEEQKKLLFACLYSLINRKEVQKLKTDAPATHYRTIALVVIELMDMLRKEKIRTDCTNEYVMHKLIQTLREKANTIKPNVYE